MASIPDSKARPRSRKIPTPKQAFDGPPGSSQSSAAGTVIHPPSHPAQSPSRTVFSASMLLLMVGASEMCACPSAKAGTQGHMLTLFNLLHWVPAFAGTNGGDAVIQSHRRITLVFSDETGRLHDRTPPLDVRLHP